MLSALPAPFLNVVVFYICLSLLVLVWFFVFNLVSVFGCVSMVASQEPQLVVTINLVHIYIKLASAHQLTYMVEISVTADAHILTKGYFL